MIRFTLSSFPNPIELVPSAVETAKLSNCPSVEPDELAEPEVFICGAYPAASAAAGPAAGPAAGQPGAGSVFTV